jgi:mono/diheme cytochrome c family protein
MFLSIGLLSAQDVEQYFNQNCKACHTIGGGKTIGPDLKGVSERADRDWLVKWMLDPTGVLASGDAYAQKILKESNGIPMIASAGMNETLAGQILDYIDTQSSTATNDAPVEITFTDEDVSTGQDYFIGSKSFENGAPSCISCHGVNSLSGLGGGKLGVNLTDVVGRLGGVRGLSGWLISPPVPTMAPLFAEKKLTEDEIYALVAFLNNENETHTEIAPVSYSAFLIRGFVGTLAMLILTGLLWGFRFRAVRRPIVGK